MNDVMRELECAIEAGCGVFCEVEVTVLKYARSILREQYAEIERLQGALEAEKRHNKKALANARAEAITEFAERLIARAREINPVDLCDRDIREVEQELKEACRE